MDLNTFLVLRVLGCAFFCVLFLQSGLDKVIDWKGNLEWLTGHFSKTVMRGQVPMMLGMVTMMELACALLCGAGAVACIWSISWIGELGMMLSLATLLMLFGGQRFAKDYPGAATLTTYFGVGILVLMILRT